MEGGRGEVSVAELFTTTSGLRWLVLFDMIFSCGIGASPRLLSGSVSPFVSKQMDSTVPYPAATVLWWPCSPGRWPAPAPAAFGPHRKCAAPSHLCAPYDLV